MQQYRTRFERSKAATVPLPNKKLTEIHAEWLAEQRGKHATEESTDERDKSEPVL